MMEEKRLNVTGDITNFVNDGRLTEASDGRRYDWRKLIKLAEQKGEALTEEEMEEYRIL